MKYKQIWKTAASCLVAALMFPSCSDDEGGGGDVQDDRYRTLMITLNSLGNQEVGTRAEGEETVTPDYPDSEKEHYISRYWLLILKQDASGEFKVDRVIDSNDPEDKVPHPNNSHPNSETELGVEVEIGQTYRFYALANLDGLEDNGTEIIEKLDGLQEGDSFDAESFQVEVKSLADYPNAANIPMSSYWTEEKITSGTDKLHEDIQLIRLIGKATVTVENLTGSAIKLKGLTMEQFRKGKIYLFPYDVNETQESGEPTRYLFQEDMVESYAPEFPIDVDPTEVVNFVDKEILIGSGETEELPSKYLYETDLTPDDITITADIEGRNKHPESTNFSFVRRNDWLKIPVRITPVNATFELNQQHMPIGGIPEKVEFDAYQPEVPIIECTTDHAGKITVTFYLTLGQVNGGTILKDPVLLTGSDKIAEGVEYTDIKVSNTKDVLLEDRIILSTSKTDVSGTLELTLQELAPSTSATAVVELLLVMVQKEDLADGKEIGPYSPKLAIPYTIKLTYDNTK